MYALVFPGISYRMKVKLTLLDDYNCHNNSDAFSHLHTYHLYDMTRQHKVSTGI